MGGLERGRRGDGGERGGMCGVGGGGVLRSSRRLHGEPSLLLLEYLD